MGSNWLLTTDILAVVDVWKVLWCICWYFLRVEEEREWRAAEGEDQNIPGWTGSFNFIIMILEINRRLRPSAPSIFVMAWGGDGLSAGTAHVFV